jgi:BA14K-like protein
MTASVSHKGKWAKFATVALAATLSASVVAGSITPALANDLYYDDQSDNPFEEQQVFPAASSQSVYRDEVGRFYIRHGRKEYIQFWDHQPRPDPVVVPRRHRDRDKNLETAIIAGVAGLAIGAIIAGSQSQPREVIAEPRRRPLPRNAFPDAPTNYQPRVITYEGAYEPWTQSWADWCSDRYRSFNISNGTYTGYDGAKRFCVAR